MSKYIVESYSVLLCFAIIFVSGLGTWLKSGYFWGGDWPYIDDRFVREVLPIPSYWSHTPLIPEAQKSFGVDGAMTAWTDPLSVLLATSESIANIKQLFSYVLVICNPTGFGLLSSYLFVRKINGPGIASVIGAVSFAFSQYVLVGGDGGQLLQGVAISAMPLVLWRLLGSFTDGGECRSIFNWKIFVVVSIQVACDPRFVYMTAVFAFMLIAATPLRLGSKARLAAQFVLTILFATVLWQAPWIAGLCLSGSDSALPSTYRETGMLEALSVLSLSDALSLIHPFFSYPRADYEVGWENFKLSNQIIFPVLCLNLGTLRRVSVGTPLLMIYVAASFLAKGTHEPLTDIYAWLFRSIPGMDAFRSPPKWAVLCNLAAAPLLALSIRSMWLHLEQSKRKLNIAFWFGGVCAVVVAVAMPVLVHAGLRRGLRMSALSPKANANYNVAAFSATQRIQPASQRTLVIPWGGVDLEKSSSYQVITFVDSMGSSWAQFHKNYQSDELNNTGLLRSPFFYDLLRTSNVSSVVVPNDPEHGVFKSELEGFEPWALGFNDSVRLVSELPYLLPGRWFDGSAVFEVPDPLGPVFVVDRLRVGLRDEVLRVGGEAAVEWGGGVVGGEELLLALPSDIGHGDGVGLRRVSGSRYVARLGREGGGWVVLSEAYAAGWRAYVVPDTEPAPALVGAYEAAPWWRGAWWWMWPGAADRLGRWALGEHVKVNGFMQAWRVPVRAPEAGGQWLVVEYYPQRAYEAGWLVTLTAGAVVAGIGVVTAGRWCIVGVSAARSGSARLGAWVRR